MSVVENIVSNIASSLGQSASGHVDASASVSASNADSGFKALLAIGSDDTAPVEDRDGQRGASSNKGDRQRDKNRHDDTPAAVVAGVPSPVIDQPKAPRAKEAVGSSESKPASYNGDENNAASAKASGDASRPATAKAKTNEGVKADKASTGAKDSVTSSADQAQASELLAEDDIRSALSDRFGNIGDILESLIQLLSGGAVVSAASDASITQVIADELGLVQGVDGISAKDGSVLATSGDVDALKQIALLKDIVSIVRQLQQELLSAAADGKEGVVMAQQTSITVTQVQTSYTQVHMPADMGALVDTLSNQLAQLFPALPDDGMQESRLGAGIDVQRMAWIKMELKQSVSSVKVQLEQLSGANENAYADALSRFQSLLNKGDADNTQGDALLKQMLAMMAKATSPSVKEDATPLVQAATGAAMQAGDKPHISNNTLLAGVAPIIIDANSNGNMSGNQQQGGGQQNAPTIPGMPATTAGQISASSAGDSAFARALSLTGQNPIPAQISLHVKTAVADGSSKITIQLDPEDLGKLDIRLHVKADGKTGIVITADNGNTLNLLQRDAHNLLRALHDAGLQADSGSLSFNLRGDQQGQQGNSHMAGNYQKAQPDEDEDALILAVSRQYTVNLNDGLDITI
jgi:flagellar hook-length control protein FliK